MLARRILDFKSDVSSLRRVVLPQRDALGAAGAARVPDHQRIARVPLPRRPRSPGPAVGRGDVLPGSDHQSPRRAPVDGLEPVEQRDEGADHHLDDLHAVDGADGHVGHERPAAALLPGGDTRSSGGSVGIMLAVSAVMLMSSAARAGSRRFEEFGNLEI